MSASVYIVVASSAGLGGALAGSPGCARYVYVDARTRVAKRRVQRKRWATVEWLLRIGRDGEKHSMWNCSPT